MIEIDLTSLYAALDAGEIALFWYLFTHGGFLIFVFFYGWLFITIWLLLRRWRWRTKIPYTILAIDVPKENEQTPKAVESIFSEVAGAYHGFSKWELWWHGKVLETFSFELVSIEGFIQYLIRTPEYFRDLIESAVYAQYPDAAITEVADYTQGMPTRFPSKDYTLWGNEFVLATNQFYPLRTYTQFEHTLTQQMIDPMASLLETFSRIGAGEQLWLQILLVPAPNNWSVKGQALIKKLIGAKDKGKEGMLSLLLYALWRKPVEEIGLHILAGFGVHPSTDGKGPQGSDNDPPTMMMHLSPGERGVVENVQIKLSKIAFNTKIRLMYWAVPDRYQMPKVLAAYGALKQLNTMNMNALTIDGKTATGANYFKRFIVDRRRRKIAFAYKYRRETIGAKPYTLNIEELATLYHFPILTVKAPLVKKIDAKRSEPPFGLPIETLFPKVKEVESVSGETAEGDDAEEVAESEARATVSKQTSFDEATRNAEPPPNLPI